MKSIWMEVTPDKFELPVAIADSAKELAKLRGVTIFPILRAVRDQEIGKCKKSKYKKVMVR